MKVDTDNIGGLTEIAAMFGISRQAMSNWTSRYEGFPAPVAVLAMGPLYRLSDVRAWAKRVSRDTTPQRIGPSTLQ